MRDDAHPAFGQDRPYRIRAGPDDPWIGAVQEDAEPEDAARVPRERAVAGEGPTLIEAMMYRLSPHSTSDNDLAYRSKEEIEEHRAKDGLPRYRQYLIDCGLWNEELDKSLDANIRQMLDEATEYADKAPYPSPESIMHHVYAGDAEGGR